MSDAARRHGLESFLAGMPGYDDPGITISVRDAAGLVNLRANPGDAALVDAAASVLGQALPLAANTFTAGSHRVYWLGPDEWLAVTAAAEAPELVRSLESALAGRSFAVNDLSGGNVVLRLAGRNAREVLARGCTLDLHPAVFGIGAAAQTGLAKAGVLIGLVDDAPVFEIVVRRSFADYLCRWFAHVARHGGVAFES